MSHSLRVVLLALASAALLAAGGKAWETWRFGASDTATAGHLERTVRQYIETESGVVESLARRVAEEPLLLTNAVNSREGLTAFFARLDTLSKTTGSRSTTVTVYVPDARGTFRVLAWSDGPAGDVGLNLLSGPSALVVVPGASGLRLVSVQPVETGGRRIAVVVTENVLSSATRGDAPILTTPFGPVTLIPTYAAGALAAPNSFVIRHPLVEVHYVQADLDVARARFSRRGLALATLPLVLALTVFAGSVLGRRRATMPWRSWLVHSLGATALIWSATLIVYWALRQISAPPVARDSVVVAGVLATSGMFAAGLWWRRWSRRPPADSVARFVAEHLATGLALGATVLANWLVLDTRITSAALPSWHSALFPFDLTGLLSVWHVLLTQLAIVWAAAALMAVAAERWRLARQPRWALLGLACWFLPVIGLVVFAAPWPTVPPAAALAMAAALAAFALRATAIRQRYRRSTQSNRLVFGFLALALPLAASYPMLAAGIDRAVRTVVESDYAPQAARQSEDIRAVLRRAQDEIDQLPLPDQVRQPATQPVESQTAFLIWNQTGLRNARVVSDVELYGPDRSLISRFALNFPEYVSRTTSQRWQGSGCTWEVFGEVTRFGSSSRTMLHAQRGVCDPGGTLIGAVVVHVAPTDYEALPFVAATTPYVDLLRGGPDGGRRPEGPVGLEVVVYGWSLAPIFATDESVTWTIDDALFARIYRDATPFWTTLFAGRRWYHVFVQQNRAGIYALGYPAATAYDHAGRLAEIAAVGGLLFCLLQAAAVLYFPFVRPGRAPLGVLVGEVRTSFYRKLFLFFVLVAVGPVFVFAVAFSGFMQSRFRVDIQGEAANVVAVAHRVFDQIAAAEPPVTLPPTDDVMVWIRQVIEQDVDLFEGPALVATSQRDLYNSGLLPGRTPATVYRRIALERLPSFVTEGQEYLVAAAPVPLLGRDAVLSVPLALRQREIEHEIEELNRGVLVGAVLVILLAAALGASLAGRVADPVARLTTAARRIAAGQIDVRIAVDTADELKRLVDDFNTMAARLVAQRQELARTNQLKAWNDMARQVAHEIKNPLTPIQLAAEHLDRVHRDRSRPLGDTLDQCVATILAQVRLLRQIASEFANFASEPISRPEVLELGPLVARVVDPYRPGLEGRISISVEVPERSFVRVDRTLFVRALTNLVENAVQAMPLGGTLRILVATGEQLRLEVTDTGVGMDSDAMAHAFEPFFSTKTAGSGLGLANARRAIEREGGTIALVSTPGHGTTVTVTLPRVEAPRDGRDSSPAPSR